MSHFTLNSIAINALALLGVITATGVATLQDLPILPDVLIGAGVGFYIGLALVSRLERRHQRELPARRVRQIQTTWAAVGSGLGLTIALIEVLA